MARILVLNANRAGIGTYHRAFHFGRQLAFRGHSVTMFAVSPDRRWRALERRDNSGLRVVESPNVLNKILPWHASGPLDILLRLREIWRGHYDLVYAFEYQPNISLPVFLLAPWRRFRLISDWCDWHAGASYVFGGRTWAHAIDRVFEERIRHRAQRVSTISNTLRERALSIGVPEGRIMLIREGVDTDYMRPMDQAACRDRLGVPGGVSVVATIRDAPAGVELLVRAVAEASRTLGEIRLLHIGHVPTDVVRLAREHGLEGNLITPGRVSDADLPRYLACADALALPLEDTLTNRARWPHKLGDMIAAGRPVLTGPGGEFPELLRERSAAVVLPFTVPAYAQAIIDVVRNPQAYAPMVANARELAQKELDWSVIGEQVYRLAQQTLGAG